MTGLDRFGEAALLAYCMMVVFPKDIGKLIANSVVVLKADALDQPRAFQ